MGPRVSVLPCERLSLELYFTFLSYWSVLPLLGLRLASDRSGRQSIRARRSGPQEVTRYGDQACDLYGCEWCRAKLFLPAVSGKHLR